MFSVFLVWGLGFDDFLKIKIIKKPVKDKITSFLEIKAFLKVKGCMYLDFGNLFVCSNLC